MLVNVFIVVFIIVFISVYKIFIILLHVIYGFADAF
jgi:hypothetical protein